MGFFSTTGKLLVGTAKLTGKLGVGTVKVTGKALNGTAKFVANHQEQISSATKAVVGVSGMLWSVIQTSTSPLRQRYMLSCWHLALQIMSPAVVSARLYFNRRWSRPLLLDTTILMQVILCRPQLAWP